MRFLVALVAFFVLPFTAAADDDAEQERRDKEKKEKREKKEKKLKNHIPPGQAKKAAREAGEEEEGAEVETPGYSGTDSSRMEKSKGNNGVGNGVDPQPPGNPKVNDGPGTGPGHPGNKGGGGKPDKQEGDKPDKAK